MDWLSAVKSFELVATTHSFTAAAEQQGISASAVSKRIDWLEKQLATSLFVRTTRQVSLTESGQGFLQKASPWLAQFDAMLESVKSAHEEPQGVLKVAATQAVGSSLLMPNIERFLQKYPKMSVQLNVLIPGNDPDLSHDLVITRYHEEFDSVSHKGTHLIDYQMSVFAAPSYLDKHPPIKTVADLAQHKMLLNNYYQQKGGILLESGEFVAFSNYNFVSENLDAILKAAIQGMGLIFISPNYVERELDMGVLAPVLPNIKSEVNRLWAYYPKTSFTPLKTRLFIDNLKQQMKGFRL